MKKTDPVIAQTIAKKGYSPVQAAAVPGVARKPPKAPAKKGK